MPAGPEAPLNTSTAAQVDVRLLLLGTAVLWGGNLGVIKLLSGHFDPVWLSGIRMAGACLPLALLLWRAGGRGWRLSVTEFAALALCGM